MLSPLRNLKALSISVLSTASFLAISGCWTSEPRQDAIDDLRVDRVAPPLVHEGTSAYEAASRVTLPEVTAQDDEHLHNVFRLSESIISGSEPHGEEAFRQMQAMGVKTILSVDGKIPDAELADKYGMKYVHVPIQYSGILEPEMLRIAKTFREQDGPFYVHCFHGKHRGPAAAAVGRVVRDGAPRDVAIAEMRQWCGTAESYEGLYRSIADGPIPESATTQRLSWDFPAAHPLEGFRHAMIEVSRVHDQLKYLYRRDWQVDADHPDVDALNEATQLASIYRTASELEDVNQKPADLRGWVDDSATASVGLRDAIAAWRAGDGDVESVDTAYEQVTQLCSTCHKSYRNRR